MSRFALLRSGDLVLDVDEALLPLVQRWVPLNAESADASPSLHSGPARQIVVRGDPGEAPVHRDVLLNLTTVSASLIDRDTIALRGTSSASGIIRLDMLESHLAIGEQSEVAAADVYSMLTLSAAFILGRMGHALVHAGAVVDQEGHAWLLVGDTHAGKTSTVVALAEAGWSYLADDQVVVSRSESGELIAEGWPRIAHLDRGWSERASTGARDAVDLRERLGAQLLRTAPLGGVILPTVRAAEPTRAQRAHPAGVFSALVRQSPWLMADATAAPRIAQLLMSVASLHPRELSLGNDSYARGDIIARCLSREASAPRDP